MHPTQKVRITQHKGIVGDEWSWPRSALSECFSSTLNASYYLDLDVVKLMALNAYFQYF